MLSVDEQRDFLRDREMVSASDPLPLARPITPTSRPGANLFVCLDGSGMFVKQPRGHRGRERRAHEARFLEAVGSDRGVDHPLRDHVAELITWEPDDGMLVLAGFVDAVDLDDESMATSRYAAEIGQAIGRVLAAVHELPGDAVRAIGGPTTGPPGRTWQAISEATGAQIDQLGPARRTFLSQLRELDAVRELARAVHAAWSSTSVIHGDVRWDNWLSLPSPDGVCELRLVDWETACPGDPMWDVGSALASYLWVWIRSVPWAPGLDERVARFARHPLAIMRPGMTALCESYLAARHLPGTAHDLVADALSHVAARLLVWASDEVDAAGGVSFVAAELVQVACNLVAEPAEGVELLLGTRS